MKKGKISFKQLCEGIMFLLFLFGISVLPVYANTTIFYENFERGDIPIWNDWSTDFGIWQVGTPTAGPGGCYNGSRCSGTILDGNYPAYDDSHLQQIGPIQLPPVSGNEEIHLRFWHWFNYGGYDAGYVQIKEKDPDIGWPAGWTTILNSGSVYGYSAGWTLKDIDITSYAGKTIKLAFLHTATRCRYCGASEAPGWYIDDIEIKKISLNGEYKDHTSMPDLNANGSQEIAGLLASPSNGRPLVVIRDSDTKKMIKKIGFFSSKYMPIEVESLPDMDSNGVSELAVLAVNKLNGRVQVQIRDAGTGAVLRNIPFFGANHTALSLTVLDDMDGNAVSELSVLAEDGTTGSVQARIKDADTGVLIKRIFFKR